MALQQLTAMHADVLCLQETHLWRHQQPALTKLFGKRWQLFFSSLATDPSLPTPLGQAKAGVLIAVRHPWTAAPIHMDDTDARVVGVRVTHHNICANVWCVYGPAAAWEERYKFWQEQAPWHLLAAAPLTLTGGDFNVLTDPADRSDNNMPPASYSTAYAFANHLADAGLADIWPTVVPNDRGFTFTRVVRDPVDAVLHSRLDRWLINRASLEHVDSITLTHSPHSDHALLQLDLSPPAHSVGRGTWRGSIPAYRHAKAAIDGALFLLRASPQRSLDPAGWWATVKRELRQIVRASGKQLARMSCAALADAHAAFTAAQAQLEQLPHWQPGQPAGDDVTAVLNDWHRTKATLVQLEDDELAKLRLRGGARNLRDYQRPTKAFFARVAVRQQRTYIPALRDRDGAICHGSAAADAAAVFYADLYSPTPTQVLAREQLLLFDTAYLDAAQQALLSAPLTADDLRAAVSKMSADKSPGPDGHTVMLYQQHPDLCDDLLHVWRYSLHVGQLPRCTRLSAMVMLKKKGAADPMDPAGYRPITLTPTDYRIISKAYSMRLLQVLPSLIGVEQTGSVPQRDIRDNLLLQRLTHTLCSRLQIPVTMLSVDIVKAFDSVDRDALWHTMRHKGVPATFVYAMQVLHAESEAVVNVNGFLSSAFPVSRGVRQGCPLAMLLFVIALEPLLCALRNQLHGVDILRCKAVLAAYADDLLVFLGTADDATRFSRIFARFTDGWSLQMSAAKTTYYHIAGASWTVPGTRLIDPEAGDTFLGIPIGPLQDDMHWLKGCVSPATSKKMAAKCALWRAESLSIQQRCLSARIAIASHTTYPLFVLPTDALDIAEWQAHINALVEHRTPRMRLGISVLQQPVASGGLLLPDLARRSRAIKAHTMLRALLHPTRPWARLFLLEAAAWLRCEPTAALLLRMRLSKQQQHDMQHAGLVAECLAAFNAVPRILNSAEVSFLTVDGETDWRAFRVSTVHDMLADAPREAQARRPSVRSLLPPPDDSVRLPPWSARWVAYAKLPGLPPMARDFLYRFNHGKTALGYRHDQPHRRCDCPYCPGVPETVAHTYLDCPVTLAALQIARRVIALHGICTAAFNQAWQHNWTVLPPATSVTFNCVMFVVCLLHYNIYIARCRHLYDGDPPPTGIALWATTYSTLRFQLHAAVRLGDHNLCRSLSNHGRWLQHHNTHWQCLLT